MFVPYLVPCLRETKDEKVKRTSKLPQLLEYDLHCLEFGSLPVEQSMVQLTFFERSFDRVIGVDEVGRGCLAGPVMAAAASYNLKDLTEEQLAGLSRLNDSKLITEKSRERLSDIIRATADFAIGHVSNGDVDRFNILNASMIAMEKAVERLVNRLTREGIEPSRILILVDGKKPLPAVEYAQLPITKGDGKSASIASASIIAKVTRDKLMARYNRSYPNYYWNQNKGYPSASHVQALEKWGPTPLHRQSFNWQRKRA